MTVTLFLIFNHKITSRQQKDAETTLGIGAIKELPFELKELWSNIPPQLTGIQGYRADKKLACPPGRAGRLCAHSGRFRCLLYHG